MQIPTNDNPVVVCEGDCLELLPRIPAGTVDAVVTDPPYPCIDREYGRWTEKEWFALMDPLVGECRRVLKPTGSAMFILQPNSERVGRMRTWTWDFMAKWGRKWGIVQDVWWWNHAAFPEHHAIQGQLMRPSLKAIVWMGMHDCYRNQNSVLWSESQANIALRASARIGRMSYPSGQGKTAATISGAALRRGGVTPFNVLPFANTNSTSSAGSNGHGAGTPESLARWCIRYICPPNGVVLDPFLGSGTMALAAIAEGRKCIGVERLPKYADIARRRVAEVLGQNGLFRDVKPAPSADLFAVAGG